MSNMPDIEEIDKERFRLSQENIQLVGMILRIRQAFYVIGTTKAMRETMKSVNEEFKALRGEI